MMQKTLLYITILVLVSCKTKTNPNFLKHHAVVQDYAHLFSYAEKDSLSNTIIDYEITSTNEVCIYTIDSLPKNVSVHDYATTLANRLGVGKKEKDNGLLILISKYNRDIAITTGYNTEKHLTDYDCKIIIDSTIVPKFKKGEFYNGINNALNRIIYKWK
ncbi:TPM domain-containing protein [uncultured Algibacter sp.]|uniref:TPM domain-containing protein n=1 Tax=uncultured Algibacter sp. TaxID=298659 RepID=UPI00262091E9|nr:TPM domain-containing protein [uncultured Algibacter sp.]